MILVDTHEKPHQGKRLDELIRSHGMTVESAHLSYADVCFEGNGPLGQLVIGIERKRISDMLDSVDSSRFTGHQFVGMKKLYPDAPCFLVVEGYWKPDVHNGVLLEGHIRRDGSLYWSPDRPGGGRKVPYSKLRRYLFSLSLGGIIVLYSRNIDQTAYDICELYHWWQKPWRDHKSLLELQQGYFWQAGNTATRDLMTLPSLSGKPSLVRRWAAELDGVGVSRSLDAERVFRKPITLATADELDWMRVPGLGPKTAQNIVREIGGYK